ncbi:MAG: helix-turn-helix domain-containing protein [Eubacteriales bacterium]|jgi:transcriptional regulator with XRE-family HTH domain
MNLGNKIKSLRKARGITQEQLADCIGISFQAVSKWENNIALPDITLAPALASYFGITMDELFDYNLKETEDKVKTICDEAYKFRKSDPIKSRAILEKGLKIYPDNDVLLNNLLYVMDYAKEPDEVISVAGRLIDSTAHDDVKYDALRCLADAYKQKGDIESAAAAIEQIPEIYFSKLSVAAWILTGKQKYDAAEKQKLIAFEDLLQMMGKIAEYFEEDSKFSEALAEAERALKLIEAMKGEPKIDNFNCYVDSIKKQIVLLKGKVK